MRALVSLLVFPFALGCAALQAAPPPVAMERPAEGARQGIPSLSPMLENVLPAVVSISVKGMMAAEQNPLLQDPFFRRFFGSPDQPEERAFEAIGSGVIVDAGQGYIVTNAHIVEEADELTVTLSSGQQLAAKKLGSDPETDIAVIKVENPKQVALTALPWSDAEPRVGDFVVAVGNPFGLEQTVTSGIISALGRTGLGIEGYEDFIQTDASINPGNSGGALVNLRGQLIGINTAILAPAGGNIGIGFAIPSTMVRGVIQQLVEHGEVRRGQLGVVVQDLNPALADALGTDANEGAVVTEVLGGSPAAKAGLQVGDVIVGIDGQPVGSSSELRNRIGLMAIGAQPELSVRRNGKTLTITPKISETVEQSIAGERLDRRLAGAVFEPVTGRQEQGVVAATQVEQGSPAFEAGLRAGDRITSVNRRQIESLQQFGEAVRQAGNTILFGVNRQGVPLLVAVQ